MFKALLPMASPVVERGCKPELKLLESKDRLKIKKKLIMIRRFLKLPTGDDDIKVHDERQGRVRIGSDKLSR